LKIWSLHGIPFCGGGLVPVPEYGYRMDRIRTLDEARRDARTMPASIPRAGGGRSSIEVRGPERDAPPENHYRGPKLSLVEHLRRDAISSVMVVIQL